MNRIDWAKILKHARGLTGLSQRNFGEEVRMQASAIHAIERGHAILETRHLLSISKFVGVKVSVLIAHGES